MAKPSAKISAKGADAKKRAPIQRKKEKRSIREYFKGVRLEMKKVVWPTKREMGAYTAVVLISCMFFALAFWAIDSGFLAILKRLLGINM